MIRWILWGKQIYDKFSRDEMTVYAAQASFFIIISAFPFIMLLMSLIQSQNHIFSMLLPPLFQALWQWTVLL